MLVLKRSIISILANLTKAILTFITGILLARGLGPEEYGSFAFLLATFIALRSALDMGASSAFFTFISKRNRAKSFFWYYIFWLIIQFTIPLFFVSLIIPDEWIARIWEGENRERIILAFVAVFLQLQVWNMIAQVGESQRLTVRVQQISIAIALAHMIFVGCLFFSGLMSIERIYYFIIVEFFIAGVAAVYLLPIMYSDEQEKPSILFKNYWDYCLPLIPYAWVGMLAGFADTWFLQHYAGSKEQAYYAVAAQFAAISLIATTSVLRILWKEVAEANDRGDLKTVQRIYERTNRLLFTLGAVISGFLIPWVSEIILFVLGEQYLEGALVMVLMFLYPVHQSLGQVNGTMFMALELTKAYVVIGLFFMLVSIVSVYFLLAPSDAGIPGFGLGAEGLAIKMVVLQIISVNFSIWWLMRRQGWKYSVLYQLVSIGSFLLLGYLVYLSVNAALEESVNVFFRMGSAGVLYFLVTFVALYFMPFLMGLKRDEFEQYVKNFFTVLLFYRKS